MSPFFGSTCLLPTNGRKKFTGFSRGGSTDNGESVLLHVICPDIWHTYSHVTHILMWLGKICARNGPCVSSYPTKTTSSSWRLISLLARRLSFLWVQHTVPKDLIVVILPFGYWRCSGDNPGSPGIILAGGTWLCSQVPHLCQTVPTDISTSL